MKCLVVIADPNTNSLCHTMARFAIAALKAGGHEVMIEDLYLSTLPGSLRTFGAPAAPHLALWASNLVGQNAS